MWGTIEGGLDIVSYGYCVLLGVSLAIGSNCYVFGFSLVAGLDIFVDFRMLLVLIAQSDWKLERACRIKS